MKIRFEGGKVRIEGLHKGIPIFTGDEPAGTSRPYPLSIAQLIARASTDDEIDRILDHAKALPMAEGTRSKIKRFAQARKTMFSLSTEAIIRRAKDVRRPNP